LTSHNAVGWPGGRAVARKSLIALVTVGVLVSIFAVCLVSAIQLLKPRSSG
jgi:hypothetical protein